MINIPTSGMMWEIHLTLLYFKRNLMGSRLFNGTQQELHMILTLSFLLAVLPTLPAISPVMYASTGGGDFFPPSSSDFFLFAFSFLRDSVCNHWENLILYPLSVGADNCQHWLDELNVWLSTIVKLVLFNTHPVHKQRCMSELYCKEIT